MKPVLILGAGPSGLMAAHACKLKGIPFSIVTDGGEGNPTKSRIGGAQFVHHAVPLIMEEGKPDGMLRYHVVGDADGYQRKVYGGSDVVPFVSMTNVRDGQEIGVWSIQKAYDTLWDDIAGGGDSLNVEFVTPEWLVSQIEEDRWGRIVSTIPRPALCLTHAGLVETKPHAFVSQRIKIANECMFYEEPDKSGVPEMSHVWYDGTSNVSWYRTSMIFGVGSTEWGDEMIDRKLPYETITATKPISNTCQCFNGQVMFTGRYGAWKKGLLIHHAFIDTWKLISA